MRLLPEEKLPEVSYRDRIAIQEATTAAAAGVTVTVKVSHYDLK